jgi:hypothetical protein
MKRMVLAALAAMVLNGTAPAQTRTPPSIEAIALQEAEEIHAIVLKRASRNMLLGIEGLISDAAGQGQHAEVRRLRDLQDAFKASGVLPSEPALETAVVRYRIAVQIADRMLNQQLTELSSALKSDGGAAGGPAPPAGGAVGQPSSSMQLPVLKPFGTPPSAPSMPPPSVATHENADFRLLTAGWGLDPAFTTDERDDIDITKEIREALKGGKLIVDANSLPMIKDSSGPRLLTLNLQLLDARLTLALRPKSKLILHPLPSGAGKLPVNPVRGTTLSLIYAGWGLAESNQTTAMTSQYLQLLDKEAFVAAASQTLGEIEAGKPKRLKSIWRVGSTLVELDQAEYSRISVSPSGRDAGPAKESVGDPDPKAPMETPESSEQKQNPQM